MDTVRDCFRHGKHTARLRQERECVKLLKEFKTAFKTARLNLSYSLKVNVVTDLENQ